MKIEFKRSNRQVELLKLTDTNLECLNKCIVGVMFTGYCNKIFRFVITSDAIKVVSDLARFQWAPQFLFQYKAVFQYALATGSQYSDIAISSTDTSTALPMWVITPPAYISAAGIAHFGRFIFLLSTIRASIIFAWSSLISKALSFSSSQATFGAKLKITLASFERFSAIFTGKVSHSLSLTYY